jgi:hypothetical protein
MSYPKYIFNGDKSAHREFGCRPSKKQSDGATKRTVEFQADGHPHEWRQSKWVACAKLKKLNYTHTLAAHHGAAAYISVLLKMKCCRHLNEVEVCK